MPKSALMKRQKTFDDLTGHKRRSMTGTGRRRNTEILDTKRDLSSSFYQDISALAEAEDTGNTASGRRARFERQHNVHHISLTERDKSFTRHSTIIEVESGYRTPRQSRRSLAPVVHHSCIYNNSDCGWSVRLRSHSLKSAAKTSDYWSEGSSDEEYEVTHLSFTRLPSSKRPFTGARALREKSPVVVNDTVDVNTSIEDLENPPHCDPLFHPHEGGAIRRPMWNRGFFDFGRKEQPSDDWTPQTTAIDTSERRFSQTVARERSLVDKRSNRTEKLYKAPDAFTTKRSDRSATVAADPFSSDRSYDLPKGDGMKIRKSSKGSTVFVEVKSDKEDFKMPPAEKLKRPKAKEATQFAPIKDREKVELPALRTPPTPQRPPPPRNQTPPSPHTEPTFACEICPEVFETAELAEDHKISHVPPLECPKCPDRFWDDAHLEEHQVAVHAPKVPCPKCDLMFETKKEMKSHAKIHEPSVKCPNCDEKFFTNEEMLSHKTIHDPNVACTDCDAMFFTDREMHNHWSETHEKKHVCRKCGEAFLHLRELKEHKPIHDPFIPCAFSKCNWKFFTEEEKESHFEMFHKPQEKCSECPSLFFTPEEVEHHFSKTHALKFKCPKCELWFVSVEDVHLHLPEHDPKVSCPECGEMFFTADRMTEHKKVHEKPFICPECPESFDNDKELQRHKVKHEPQLKCPKCTEMFFTAEQVEEHMTVHRPQVKCIKCDEMFFTMEEMEMHLPIHFVKQKIQPPPPPPPELAPPALPEVEEEETPELIIEETKTPIPPPVEEPVDPNLKPLKPLRKRIKPKFRKPRATPMSRMEPEPVHDPLDYLAKYCIIVKDRVPLYRKVFKETLERQKQKFGIDYDDDEDHVIQKFRLMRRAKSGAIKIDPDTGDVIETNISIVNPDDLPPGEPEGAPEREEFEGDFDPKLNLDLDLTKKSVEYDQHLMNQRELLNKINFTISSIESRQVKLYQDNMVMEKERVKLVCEFARNELREDLFPKPDASAGKKGKKGKDKKGGGGKKGKKGPQPVEFPDWMSPELVEDVKADEYVMARLNEDQWDMLASDRKVEALTLQIKRNLQKVDELEKRKDELTIEKATLQLDFKESRAEETYQRPTSKRFRRRQSELYQLIHTSPDPEIEIELLEESLTEVNDHLITEKECEYIFYILDLPKRERINFKLFCVIAALSEKIKMLEPMIRKLINQLDFEALQVKMDRAKDLFYLLDDETSLDSESGQRDIFDGEIWPKEIEQEALPRGTVSARSLAIELAAGGITTEHANQVIEKFCREKRGVVEFLDFLTYVPLFVEIHEHIKMDPLGLSRYK